MARDEHLLYSPGRRPAALRIYAWDPPTISLGYFQRYDDVAGLPADIRELAVVRRPTGGGAILHDREITYCLIVDERLPVARAAPVALYRLAHEAWREALDASGFPAELAPDSFPMPSPRTGPFFCFQKPGKTDLVVGAGKLLGSAQRRIPGGVMQHGSLILGKRFASHPGVHLDDPPAEVVAALTRDFVASLALRLELAPQPAQWSAAELAEADSRRAKYAGDEWNRRR